MSRPTSASGRLTRLARYGFGVGDAERTGGNGVGRAAELLGPDGLGLWDPDTQEPVDPPAGELLTALSRTADPDLTLRQLHRIVEAERRSATPGTDDGGSRSGDAGSPESLLAALHADPGLRRRILAILGASSALGDHLVANPEQWRALRTGVDGVAPNADGLLHPDAAGPEDGSGALPAVAALRRAYRLALLRIAAADLTGGRGLEQTMVALSALADATLADAYGIAVGELPEEPRCPGWRWWRWASAAATS
ncbi:hypothetical protein GCM10027615_74760 [Plantactinospora veratri]